MNHLNGIEPHRHASRIETGNHRRGIDQRQCSQKNGHRPVKANRPAERLLVDDINQNEREREPQGSPHKIGEQAYQASLHHNQLADLPRRGAQKPKQPQFASTVDDQSEKRSGNAHHRDRSEEHTSELQSRQYLVCRLLLEKKKKNKVSTAETSNALDICTIAV